MQYKIQAAERDGSLQSDLADITKFDFLKKSSNSAELEREKRELQAVHESEIQTMNMSLKKAEKELGYKDEEVRHYKNMAS